ncbi:MAG: hypothetical protein RLZZ59_471, partial [Pseudomonadota bacterium]
IKMGGKNGAEIDMKVLASQEEAKLEKLTKRPKADIEKAQAAKEALTNFKQLATNFESSVRALSSFFASSNSLELSVPSGSDINGNASIVLSPNAEVGVHSIQINHIASKQRYVIGLANGAPVRGSNISSNGKIPFAGTSKADVFRDVGLSSGDLVFVVDNVEVIVNLTSNENLYEVADKIKDAAGLQGKVTSYVSGNEKDGYFLTIESVEAGVKKSFELLDFSPEYKVSYVDPDQDVGVVEIDINQSGSTALLNTATAVDFSNVSYVDIYKYDGGSFLGEELFADLEDLSFNLEDGYDPKGDPSGVSNVRFFFGGQQVTADISKGLSGIAQAINGAVGSNIKASVILPDGAGFGHALRIEAVTGSIPEEFFNSPALIKNDANGILLGKQIKTYTARDTEVFLDGNLLPASSSTILTGVSPDIDSINVSGVIPLSTFSILQGVSSEDEVVRGFVQGYNDLQQFISQQSQIDSDGMPAEGAVLYKDSALRSIKNKLDSITAQSVNGLTLEDIGIKKYKFPGDLENGLVPANYLKITDATLSAQLVANFSGVLELFNGSLDITGTTEAPAVVPAAQLAAISNPSSFYHVQTGNPGCAVELMSDNGSLDETDFIIEVTNDNPKSFSFTHGGGLTLCTFYQIPTSIPVSSQFIVTGNGFSGNPNTHITFKVTIPNTFPVGGQQDRISFRYNPPVIGTGGVAANIQTLYKGQANGGGANNAIQDLAYVSGTTFLDAFKINIVTDAGGNPIFTASHLSNPLIGPGYAMDLQVVSHVGNVYTLTGDGSLGNPFNDFVMTYDSTGLVASQNYDIIGSFQASNNYIAPAPVGNSTDAKVLLLSAPTNFNVSKFNINVVNTNLGYGAQATDHSTGQVYNLTFTPIGTTGGIISDTTYNTPFGGVIMKYTLPTGGIAVDSNDTIANISYEPGIATTLGSFLGDYLDPTNGALKSSSKKYERIEEKNLLKVDHLEKASQSRVVEMIQALLIAEMKYNRVRSFLDMLNGSDR